MTFTLDPGPIAAALDVAYGRLTQSRFAEALWQRRLEVWSGDAEVQRRIGSRLGWLDALEFARPQAPRLLAFADAIRQAGFTDIVLLGMGGSSLAAEVFRRVLGVAAGFPRFRVLDSVDPDAVRTALEPAATSLFILASKSGTTIEPNVMAEEAARRIRAAGHAEPGARLVAVTDQDTALHRRAGR